MDCLAAENPATFLTYSQTHFGSPLTPRGLMDIMDKIASSSMTFTALFLLVVYLDFSTATPYFCRQRAAIQRCKRSMPLLLRILSQRIGIELPSKKTLGLVELSAEDLMDSSLQIVAPATIGHTYMEPPRKVNWKIPPFFANEQTSMDLT